MQQSDAVEIPNRIPGMTQEEGYCKPSHHKVIVVPGVENARIEKARHVARYLNLSFIAVGIEDFGTHFNAI
ncbi:MAG: hypothetical protein AAGG48_30960 [Planctomycetota bacterium]